MSIPEQDPDEAQPAVWHRRDLVVEGGEWEQDYHYLDYDFAPAPFTARAYFDENSTVLIEGDSARALTLAEIDRPILAYLQYRYDRLQVVGENGRRTLWERA